MLLRQNVFRCSSAILLLAMFLAIIGSKSGSAFAAAGASNDERRDLLDLRRQAVPRIPPGTIVDADNANGWNRLVLFAKPRVALGAVNELPRMVRQIAARFPVVIMARVAVPETENVSNTYTLEEVGVGYCVAVASKNVIVRSDKLKDLNVELGTIERIVLERNEEVLDDMVQIACSNTFVLFDVKALMLQGGTHQDTMLRYLVWVSPETGQIASIVWPLTEEKQGALRLIGDALVALPGGFQEDRVIHVSADEIMLGIPSLRAFALARMPRGKKIPVTSELAALAAHKTYTRGTLSKLLQALREAF